MLTSQRQLSNWLQSNCQLAEGCSLSPNGNAEQRIEVLMSTIKEKKKITKESSLYLGVAGMVAKAWAWDKSQINLSLSVLPVLPLRDPDLY